MNGQISDLHCDILSVLFFAYSQISVSYFRVAANGGQMGSGSSMPMAANALAAAQWNCQGQVQGQVIVNILGIEKNMQPLQWGSE